MDATNKKLIQLLLEKTNAKLLTWSRGSTANEFKTELSAATLHISYVLYDGLNEFAQTEVLSLYMYNGTGAPITLVSENDMQTEFELLKMLYNSAMDSCTKESETIENLFDELNALGNR